MAAVWDADDAQSVQLTEARDHSVVVERSSQVYGSPEYDSHGYDPFDEDDRLAQLPDDPFDEPADESVPVPESEDEMQAVEDALDQEIKRRQSLDDPFEGSLELDNELEQPLDEDLLEDDPLKELRESDPLDDDDPTDELFQPKQDDWQGPDLDIEQKYSDPEDGLTEEELEEQRKELERERRESEENCRQELADLEADQISSIDLDIRVEGSAGEDYPFECSVSSNEHQPRQWPQITYNWKASCLCHKPLYFEQVQLERYGHSWGPYVQPIMSGVHFFGSVPILPYKMGIRTPCECVYTLGYYRPGSCAPYMIEPVPFTWRAAMFQGAAVTGTAFAIP